MNKNYILKIFYKKYINIMLIILILGLLLNIVLIYYFILYLGKDIVYCINIKKNNTDTLIYFL